MKASLRRIANTLLVISVLSLGLSFVSSLSIQCGEGAHGCLASLFTGFDYTSYETDFLTSGTTAANPPVGLTLTEINTFVQLVSAYALVVAVLVLIGLECIELHYVRKILRSRRQFRLR